VVPNHPKTSDTGSALATHSAWNALSFAIALLAQLLVVPIVIRWIGLAEFGVAGIVLAIFAPFSVVGIVLGQALTRELAEKESRGDKGSANEIFRTAWIVCALISLGIAMLVAAFSPQWLVFLVDGRSNLSGLVLIFAIGWLAKQLAFIYSGAMVGRRNFKMIAVVSLLSAFVTVLAVLGSTVSRPDALGYLAGMSLSFVLVLLLWHFVSDASKLRFLSYRKLDRAHLSSLFSFGKWQGLSQLAGNISNQADRYLLGVFATPIMIGHYNAANRLQEAAYAFTMKCAEVLFPYFSADEHRGDGQASRAFLLASWIVTTLSVAVLGPIVAVSDALMRLWVGAESAVGDGGLLLRTLVVGGIIGCGSNVFTYFAMGRGRTDLLASLSWAYSLVTISGTYFFMKYLGPQSAGAGLLLASLVRVALSLWWTPALVMGARRDLRALGAAVVLPILTGTTLGYLLHESGGLFGFDFADSWFVISAQYLLLVVTFIGVLSAATSLTSGGRDILGQLRTVAAALLRRA